jgi:predicted 3-demethylubiquinone-9 3-methyltransferase (glyoxalase superfamily)
MQKIVPSLWFDTEAEEATFQAAAGAAPVG